MTNGKPSKDDRQQGQKPTPAQDDVAGLYSWAKMEGSKYRDFSASRKQARNQTQARNHLERSKRDQEAEEAALAAVKKEHTEGEVPRQGAGPQPVSTPSAFEPSRMLHRAEPPGPRRVPSANKKSQRVAMQRTSARWTALKSVFEQPEERHDATLLPTVTLGIPSLAFVSLAGGVGKTSLVASLGCSLADHGESVLLVDTNSYGLLPLYFGAREFGGELTRTFASGTTAVPIQVMTLDRALDEQYRPREDSLIERIVSHAHGMHRLLIDVSTGSTVVAQQILRLSPRVVVILTPDMASVVSLQPLEIFFRNLSEEGEHPVELLYLLNQFDPSLRLHMDVRALLTRELGERLLPVVIHHSNAFSEALAEGMTVVDYAPDSQATEDLHALRDWLRELDGQALGQLETVRWRER